ncbi:hypothetical protein K493DRAFT_194149, partial [Basidiobolus meristosporus CBS 931.73]
TEFTKRRNWQTRVINELKDLYLVLSPTCGLIYCSPSSQETLGYKPEELTGRNVLDLIHVDDSDNFTRMISLSSKDKRFQLYCRLRKKDDRFVMFEIKGHPRYNPGDFHPTCYFCIARPYFSKANAMLDSFLQLKIENELLQKRLREFGGSSQRPASSDGCSGIPQTDGEKSPPNTGRSSIDLRGGKSETVDGDIVESPPGYSSGYTPKRKAYSERICTECGTTEAPEWRKGPNGPKTLCNACGLRWAKKAK